MQAIINKYGFKEGLTTKDGKIVKWPYASPKPTSKELDIIVQEYDVIERVRVSRRKEYPPIEEQLDMIHKDKVNGTNIWCDLICNIKTKHPKS